MTYAIGKNLETCAHLACHQPAEMELRHPVTVGVEHQGSPDEVIDNLTPRTVHIGWCLEHGLEF